MHNLEWTTEKRKVKDLIKSDINPRKLSPEKRQKLERSLIKFNLTEIPVIDTDNVIIGGNQRCEILNALGRGDDTIDVRVPNRKLTDLEAKELAIISNTHAGEFDFEMLELHFADLDFEDIGFDLPEFEKQKDTSEAQEDDYDIPDEVHTDIVLGDLFEIGEHRLLCGDSTSIDHVTNMMDGEIADLVFTDPPYGVSYQSNMRVKSKKFDIIENDDKFITEWINHIPIFSKGFVIVWTSWKVVDKWIDFLRPIGDITNLIIWDKGCGGMGDLTGAFATDYEMAICFNRGANITGKRLGSVWHINRDDTQQYKHPTQKPVKLAAMAIENITTHRGLILDLFLGSGTTMVAAHQLNRKCYGMELDPKYCQVIVDRMIKLDPAIKVLKNGEPYSTPTP